MMDIDEKTKCFQGAFVLARTDRPLTKANIEVFKKLRGFLDDDIVDKIDNFKPGRKGILLIGDDFDLLDGIVSYIWYKHPLIYPMVGNNATENDMANALRSYLAYKNAAGHKEHAINDFLFSKNLLSHMHGGILFLKNTNPTYTDLLERIVGTLQDVNCRPFIQEKRSRIIRHSSIEGEIYELVIQRREEEPKFKLMPGIIVMNVKQTDGLSEDFLQQFEVIPLKDKGGKKNELPASRNILQSNRWSVNEGKLKVYYCYENTKYPIKLSPLHFCVFHHLFKRAGKYVEKKPLGKCWGKEPSYENYLSDCISKINNKIKNKLKENQKIDYRNINIIVPDNSKKAEKYRLVV